MENWLRDFAPFYVKKNKKKPSIGKMEVPPTTHKKERQGLQLRQFFLIELKGSISIKLIELTNALVQ
ncbi:hypothetical protein ABEY59_17620 [Bacillus albus]|uniref:hypothetical protein n=1 Tax=Bacillus albus TaxID=2026189 RepID=UPI003D1D87D3